MVKFVEQYRERLEGVETVRVDLVHEILDVMEAELEEAHGEYTIDQAVEMSGRSRSFFERRLDDLEERGLARKPGRDWLIKAAAIPDRERKSLPGDGFDEDASDDEILRRLAEDDRRSVN